MVQFLVECLNRRAEFVLTQKDRMPLNGIGVVIVVVVVIWLVLSISKQESAPKKSWHK